MFRRLAARGNSRQKNLENIWSNARSGWQKHLEEWYLLPVYNQQLITNDMAKKISIDLFIKKIEGISLHQTEELHKRVGDILKEKQLADLKDAESKVAQLRMQYGIPPKAESQSPAY